MRVSAKVGKKVCVWEHGRMYQVHLGGVLLQKCLDRAVSSTQRCFSAVHVSKRPLRPRNKLAARGCRAEMYSTPESRTCIPQLQHSNNSRSSIINNIISKEVLQC